MTHYELFSACFPELDLAEETFYRLLDFAHDPVLEHRKDGQLAGYALLYGNALRLLCVRPENQKQGIGTALFHQAEEMLRARGEGTLVVGGASSRLFQGAPENVTGFFARLGCRIGEPYEEMRGDLTAFRAEDHPLPAPENAMFGWYQGDFSSLQAAVAKVDPDWVQWFHPGQRVFCGTVDGEIASFCAVDVWPHCLLSNGRNKVGAPGCVGTVPAFRRRGIGLKMVALACEELKKQGCDTCFIHYTGVAHWYAKLGISTFLKWYFCEKAL